MEIDWVGNGLSTCRHVHGSLTVESQADGRRLVYLATASCRLGVCQFHSLDYRGPFAELIGQLQTYLITTD